MIAATPEALVGAALWATFVSCLFGAALFVIVESVVRARALDAAIRHALWTIALWTTALLPLVAFGAGVVQGTSGGAAVAPDRAAYSPSPSRQDGGATQRPVSAAADPKIGPLSDARTPTLAHFAASPLRLHEPHLGRGQAYLAAGLWLAGAAIGLAALARGIVRVRGLKRRSDPLDKALAGELPWLTENRRADREIYLRLSYEIETPIAVGFRRPVILIPTDLATRDGLTAIEALVMHEHAHLRRRDDWTNLAERVIERIFWFNPLVWLFGRRIALEREIAADDAVVAATGRPNDYARSLWQLAREMRMSAHTVVAPGALTTRKQISVRIEALLDRHPVAGAWRTIAAGSVLLTAISCTVAVAANAPRLSFLSPIPTVMPAAHVARTEPAFPARPAAPALPAVPAGRAAPAAPAAPPAAPAIEALLTGSTVKALSMMRASSALEAASVRKTARTAAAQAPVARLPAALGVADCSDCAVRSAPAAHVVSPGSDLSGASLRDVDWRGQTLTGVNLSGADLTGALLDGTHFIDSNLSGAQLTRAALNSAVVSGTTIDGASLRGAHTTGLRIIGASLSGMDFRDIDVRSLVAACAGCDISGANLRSADLHGVRISGVNFSGSDLHAANLNGANVVGVNFSGSDLHAADLRNATFTGCTFDGAILPRAVPSGARFMPRSPYDANMNQGVFP